MPPDTPVTTPEEFTVATLVVAETHGLDAAGVPEPVKEVVKPTHTLSVPVIDGDGLTVIVPEAVTAGVVHPPVVVTV